MPDSPSVFPIPGLFYSFSVPKKLLNINSQEMICELAANTPFFYGSLRPGYLSNLVWLVVIYKEHIGEIPCIIDRITGMIVNLELVSVTT